VSQSARSPALGYGLAVAVSLLAVALNHVLTPLIDPNRLPPFLAAVMVAAWYGGLGPGIAALTLTAVANDWFFSGPGVFLGSVSELARDLLYVLSAGLIVVLATALRRARERAAGAADEARRHVESLRESDRTLRALLDSVRDYAIVKLDVDGRILSWSPGAVRIFGYAEAEVVGRHVSAVYPPDAEIDIAVLLRAASEAGRVATQGWRVRKDGTRFWSDVVVTPSRDEAGRLQGFWGISRDITERKGVEDAMRASETKFRKLLELAPDAIVIVDDAGRMVLVNTQAQQLFGYTEDDMVGQPVEMLLPEAARATHHRHRADYMEQPRTRPMGVGLDLAGRRKDGTTFPVEISLSPMPSEDGTLVMSAIRDVTERRRAEASVRASESKFRKLLELAPDAIVIVDARGHMVLVNTQAQRLFGYTETEMLGQPVEILLPDAARGGHYAHRARYEAAPRTRPMGAGLDLAGRRKDGTTFPVEISLAPMPSEDGPLVMSAIRDVTDRKAVEARVSDLNADLERRVAELAAVNKELESFSYSVSHDLRAPLRSIDGFSQALLEEYGDVLTGEGQDYLKRVRAATQRMGELIDDLLNLARVTRREMRREPVDLSAIARSIVAQLEKNDPGRRVDIAICDGLVGWGDPHLLRLVLENLLGNAWKFTGRQPAPRIEFGMDRRNGTPVYYVRDNGVGFDMAYSFKLFGAFQRLHAMREFPGTGIGLATVQRVINRHGGRVWADAQLGKGATFHFTLQEGADRG